MTSTAIHTEIVYELRGNGGDVKRSMKGIVFPLHGADVGGFLLVLRSIHSLKQDGSGKRSTSSMSLK